MTSRRRTPRGLLLALIWGGLSGCVYLPRQTQVYDPGCRIQSKQMVLELAQVGALHHCSNQSCLALLVSAGVVTAASAVVSGTIVVAGNIVYWFEKQGACAR